MYLVPRTYSYFVYHTQDVSFWTSEGFTENNLCEVVRGIAGKRSCIRCQEQQQNRSGCCPHRALHPLHGTRRRCHLS